MQWLDTLERRFGRFTFPHLLAVLLVGQVLVFGAISTGRVPLDQLMLNADKVVEGEVWRLLTFMVMPLDMSPFLFALGAYITWLIGSSLERQWGEFRFGLYLGLGWLATVLGAFLVPGGWISNTFIMGSLTLAFARLFPEVEFLLFFLIPVKVKYIGYVFWGFYLLTLLAGPADAKMQVAGGILPFLVFFGPGLVFELKERKRTREYRERSRVDPEAAFHVCSVCGKTDKTDPELAFRYRGEICICETCLSEERGV